MRHQPGGSGGGLPWDEDIMNPEEERAFFSQKKENQIRKLIVKHYRQRWYEKATDKIVAALMGRWY